MRLCEKRGSREKRKEKSELSKSKTFLLYLLTCFRENLEPHVEEICDHLCGSSALHIELWWIHQPANLEEPS